MTKVYRIKSGAGWFVSLGRDGMPFMSSDMAEAKIMLHGEADRISELIEANGFVAEIVEVK
jgi:hypothetical protein